MGIRHPVYSSGFYVQSIFRAYIVLIYSHNDKQIQLMLETIQQLKHKYTLINTSIDKSINDIQKIFHEKFIDLQQPIDMVVLDIRKLKLNQSLSLPSTKQSTFLEINNLNNSTSQSLNEWCKQLRSYSLTKDSVIVGLLRRKCSADQRKLLLNKALRSGCNKASFLFNEYYCLDLLSDSFNMIINNKLEVDITGLEERERIYQNV
ncbi:hypothetical protein EWB00_000999 [Schistosoma japonicum]|uniref:Uncharacterized protein n=1 Tax=Schistosoma japonicum TaxID=6182 RepID=A0A4Z2DI29_SCHJA|nr:hypothetical protein EWB00_000999 [Schistosoma japonicum]